MNPDEHGRWNGTDSPSYESKFCAHCQQQRPIADFARRRKGSDARQGWCRECVNATRREAYARAKGIDHGNA